MDKKTEEYYRINYKSFYNSTKDGDFQDIYERFERKLKGKKILDLGCGGGRDLLYFKSKGYDIEGIDGCLKLVEIARRRSGQMVYYMNYRDMDFYKKYDGVWSMAGLVHQDKKSIRDILYLINRSLKAKGIIYLSFKYGDFQGYIDGRYFSYINEDDLDFIVDLEKYRKVDLFYTRDKRSILWINIILEKIN